MGRAGAKRSKQPTEESPSAASSASKKRKTDKKKIAPQRVEEPVQTMDPYLKSFCEKFKHPADSIQFLLQNSKMSVDEFFKNHWETTPLAMHAAEPNTDLSKLFSLEYLTGLVEESEKENGEVNLAPERDYIFAKYVNSRRDDAVVDVITKEILTKLYGDKYAVQINQPQRFQDALWAFVEKLECHFGSLVSSHVFLLPEGTQVTSPRYEDTEKFILQLSGHTTWKLHKTKKEFTTEYNDNLSEEDLGDEVLTAELKAGDVLYIPKGTVFQSKAVTESAHINFSTFQNMNQTTFMIQTIGMVLEEQSSKIAELRRGVPLGYLPKADSISNAEYADLLVKLADSVRARKKPLPRPEGLIQDFMSFRLPPYGYSKFEIESGAPLSPESKVSFRNKDHITWFTRKFTDGDLDEDNPEEEGLLEHDLGPQHELVVYSSMSNDRSRHMMIESRLLGVEGDAFSVGVEYEELLEAIYSANEPVLLKSLTKKSKQGNLLDAVVVARGLFSIGAIEVQ